MSTVIDPSRIFTRKQVESLLTATIGKTLLQADAAQLFAHHEGRDKVKGIAGDIIEESVLGCKKDSKQEPDILVDGVLTELKTTGMIEPKKKDSPYVYECKVTMKLMHTSTNDNLHSLQETQFPYTSHNCSLSYGLSSFSLSHKQPNVLRSKNHYRATNYTHAHDWHHSPDLQASAQS
jgi:hypothetical protein